MNFLVTPEGFKATFRVSFRGYSHVQGRFVRTTILVPAASKADAIMKLYEGFDFINVERVDTE